MRKEYGKILRTLFASEMKRIASHFHEVKVNSMYFWPGDRAYCWQASAQLYCWIVLSPSNKGHDEFNVLLGWSKHARYPELSMVPCAQSPSPDRNEFSYEEYLTRLAYLWSNDDYWWVISEFHAPTTAQELADSIKPITATQARETVAPIVSDAINKIKEFGLPYLEDLAHRLAISNR